MGLSYPNYYYGSLDMLFILALILPLLITIAWVIVIIVILVQPENAIRRAKQKESAKRAIYGKKGMLFLCDLVVGLICCIPILNLIIGPALNLGIKRIYLGVTQDRKPEVRDSFSGMESFGKAWVLSFLVGLFTFLWAIIPIAGIWLGIQKRLSYSMSTYILAESPQIGSLEAIEISKRMMHGHKMELFALELSFIGWNLLGIITFGIVPLVFTNYYYRTTYTNFYLAVKAQWLAGEGRNYQGGYIPHQEYMPPYGNNNNYHQRNNARLNMQGGTITGVSGMYNGAVFPLPADEELIFGRDSAQCHIVITRDAEKISRKHMSIYIDNTSGAYIVTDYSSNGTYLSDGTRLKPYTPTKVSPGATIYLSKPNNSFRVG